MWQIGTVQSCVSSWGLLVAQEDSLLEHISAGLVLGGGKIWSWAKAKEWSKDSWVLFLIPTQV